MNLENNEKIINVILSHLDQKVWQILALKVIQKIAPIKMTKESNKMFSDFTVLNSGLDKNSGTNIIEQVDNVCKITQNYILGTSKMVQRSLRSKSQLNSLQMHRPLLASKVTKKRIKTVSNYDQKIVKEPKMNNYFALNIQQKRDIQQQKFEQSIRLSRESKLKFTQNLQNSYKHLLIKRQQKSYMQRKKFKEMKTFTYDFEGRLVSTGHQKKERNLNVFRVNSEMAPQMVTTLKKSKKYTQEKVKQIVNKKVVQHEKNFVSEYMKQQKEKQLQKQAKQKQYKKSAFEKNGILSINVMDIFQKENSVSAGVQITQLSSKSKISGRTRDKDDKKNLNLLQFKDQTKKIELFPQKKVKQGAKTTSYFRTEGNQPLLQRDRVKTEANKYSCNFTSSAKYSRFRGIIRILNHKLYNQNFNQSNHC